MNKEKIKDLAERYYNAFPRLFGKWPEEPDWKYKNINITRLENVIIDTLKDLPENDPGTPRLVDIKVLDEMERMLDSK